MMQKITPRGSFLFPIGISLDQINQAPAGIGVAAGVVHVRPLQSTLIPEDCDKICWIN